MKTLTFGLFTVALCLSVGCGDDDDSGNGAAGGNAGASQGGKAGAASGGKASGGMSSGGKASGGATSGGKASGGAGDVGGAGGSEEGGFGGGLNEGGAGGVPVTPPGPMCQPPTPPEFGAGGAGGADGAGGAENAGAPGSGNGAAGVAIRGTFSDSWDSHHVITNSTWTSGRSVFHISLVDNADHFLIARNDQNNAWNACLWSRFDWTRSAGKLYYCQTAYSAASEAAALNTPAADPSDPPTSGCGGFPWTELVRE